MVDKETIKNAIANIIVGIGADGERDGLKDTPGRVASAYEEIFSGIGRDPSIELTNGFEEDQRDLVLVRDLPFYSMCEHHLLPFLGSAHIGYLANGKVSGLSKLARVVDILSRRPQMQERLTEQIADTIFNAVCANGLVVLIDAEHLCMTMRGVQKPGTRIVTMAVRGEFQRGDLSREQLISIVQGQR